MTLESEIKPPQADINPIQVVEKYLSILNPNDGEVSREFIEESSQLTKALMMLEERDFDEQIHGKIIQLGEVLYALEDNAYKKVRELRQDTSDSKEYEKTRTRGQFWREIRYRADSAINKIVVSRKKPHSNSVQLNHPDIAIC